MWDLKVINNIFYKYNSLLDVCGGDTSVVNTVTYSSLRAWSWSLHQYVPRFTRDFTAFIILSLFFFTGSLRFDIPQKLILNNLKKVHTNVSMMK